MLSVYVVTVLAATARAIAFPFAPDFAGTGLMLFVVTMGIIAAAALVQADSPTRSNVFWATRPFSRSAVASAKMLVVIVALAVLPLVGQIVALLRFDLGAGRLPVLLVHSAVSYGMWLLAAMLIGALTADLRTFILTFVAVAVGITIAQTFMSRPLSGAPTSLTRNLIVASIAVLGIWLLVHVYRTRRATPSVWGAAAIVLAGVLWFVFSGTPAQVLPRETASSEPRLSIALEDSGRVTGQRLDLRLNVEGTPPGQAMAFVGDSAILRLRSGAIIRPRSLIGSSIFNAPDVPVTPSVHWLGSHNARFLSHGISVNLEPRDVRAVENGLATLELTGRLVTFEPRVVGRLPLRSGVSLTNNGVQTRIEFVDHPGDDVIVQLQAAEVLGGQSPADRPFEFGEPQLPAYGLVNTNRNEAILLYSRSSGGGPAWLVLPGNSLSANTFTLGSELGRRATQAAELDDAWYRNAQLFIVRWVSTGNYPVRARAMVP
jgi:hypothetical protein